MLMSKSKLFGRGAILRLFVFLSLLVLTSCGTVISVDNLLIQFPTRSAQSPTPSATATASPGASSSPTQGAMTALILENLRLRSGPSTAYTVIRIIPANSTVQLNGRNSDGSWLNVRYGQELGWVSSQFVQTSTNVQSLPVIASPSQTPSPEPTPTRERISFNINGEGVPNEAYLLQVMTSPCRTIALVMNNLSLATRIKELCPDTIVISRNYSVLEGDEWALRSAQNMVAQWQREGHPEIVRHSTNEPSFGRGLRLQQFVQAECELMRLARQAGFTVAMGNFSVGIFEASDIDAGLFDPYLRCLNQYGHFLGLHEYSLGVLAFGIGQWQPQCLLDRLCVQPSRWQAEPLRIGRVWSDGIWQQPPYWYLGRGIWWINRADTIGIARPRIVATEFGWDNLPNIKPVIEPLRSQFGIDRYFDDMRGVNTYQNLWAWYWHDWTFAQAACEQLLWAERVYPAEYIGFALFTWSTNPHWLQTDFSGRENPAMFELHQCLENYHSQN